MIRISKGLDIPISGAPKQQIDSSPDIHRVALLGSDYPCMKPRFLVQEGDSVKLGQPLFSDKKNPEILYTSPGCGVVTAIKRAERREFISIVIELCGDDEISFSVLTDARLSETPAAEIEKRLLSSGLWTAFRTRPFAKIPVPGTKPAAIFVTAIDSNPLAADPDLVINENEIQFHAGLKGLKSLTTGKLYLCRGEFSSVKVPECVTDATFSGPHPVGLSGTHIHFLEPVSLNRQVWHINYQDVIAVGKLFLTGRISVERVVSIAGPKALSPRLIRTRMGADILELTKNEIDSGEVRIISGSILSGHTAAADSAFLGRYHCQISIISEERERKFLNWLAPGFNRISVKPLYASALLPARNFSFGSSTNGSSRGMVPIGAFEKIMPLDLKITWLLRSLLADDVEMAQQLGCLELSEEDLALCSYVCSGKIDYGSHLRRILNRIEEEG
ncbi:MAG: Na(+)-translocating NADH-quinone reductase subunit A [Desulfuromonadaceae bacterium]|nr:Na(+)-translocating NADH-quinone reductase subunit A [Desulfuromonadaceae bacterium]MDD2855209.1 Na(+)-translocating NADH-quinone reductase subunit A [Desulfuromonadaceae bacterium]